METLTTKQKVLNSPLTKIFSALIVFIAMVITGQQIASKLTRDTLKSPVLEGVPSGQSESVCS